MSQFTIIIILDSRLILLPWID